MRSKIATQINKAITGEEDQHAQGVDLIRKVSLIKANLAGSMVEDSATQNQQLQQVENYLKDEYKAQIQKRLLGYKASEKKKQLMNSGSFVGLDNNILQTL